MDIIPHAKLQNKFWFRTTYADVGRDTKNRDKDWDWVSDRD